MHRLFQISLLMALFLTSLGFAAPVQAAAFCLRLPGGQPQCLYDDATECRRRAEQLFGLCTANPDILTIIPSNGKYCVVSSGHSVQCAYPDRGSCDREAKRSNSVCIDSTQQQEQPDPHRETPNRPY